jgi:hypothetical protein
MSSTSISTLNSSDKKVSKKLNFLKKQIIITDPEDNVQSTKLSGHPSLGKPDEVVWSYEVVMQQYKNKLYKYKLFICSFNNTKSE